MTADAKQEEVAPIDGEAMPEKHVTVAQDHQPSVPAVSESAAIMSVIERAARDPNVDIDKMRQLMDMRKELLAQESEMAFNTAMAAAQAEMVPVARDAKNAHTKSTYARIEAIAKAITPIRSKHGFSSSFGTKPSEKEGEIYVTCQLAHNGGHSKYEEIPVPLDLTGAKGTTNKNPIQALGSSLTYGRRYLTLLMFDIATEDDDGNAAGGTEPISDEQLHTLSDKIEQVGADIQAFCKYLNVDALKELTTDRFEYAMRELEIYGQKKKAPAHA